MQFIDDPVCINTLQDTASNPDEQSDSAKDEIRERSGYEVTGGDMVLDPPSVERASSVGGINQWDYHVIPYKVVAVEKLPLQNAFKINYVCALA